MRRLCDDFGVKDVAVGRMRVAYRECVCAVHEHTEEFKAMVAGGDPTGAGAAEVSAVIAVRVSPLLLGSGEGCAAAPPGDGGGGGVGGGGVFEIGGAMLDEDDNNVEVVLVPTESAGSSRSSSSSSSSAGGGGEGGGEGGEGEERGGEGAAAAAAAAAPAAATGRALPAHLLAAAMGALEAGAGRGALLGSPLRGVRIELLEGECWWGGDSSAAAVAACAASALSKALGAAAPALMEPVMLVRLVLPASSLGAVVSDLSGPRRGVVLDVGSGMAKSAAGSSDGAAAGAAGEQAGEWARVEAEVPLAEMVGYSTALRSITAGNGSFDMNFREYRQVDDYTAKQLMEQF